MQWTLGWVKKKKVRVPQGDWHSCKQDFKSLRQAPDAPDNVSEPVLGVNGQTLTRNKIKNYYEFA